MQCKCGCNEPLTTAAEHRTGYVWGHKTRTIRPQEKLNPCACSCGELVRGTWAKGHCNRKPKPECAPCACDCGELAAAGSQYLPGHNSRTEGHRQMKREMMDRLWKETPEKFDGREVWSKGLTKETDERLSHHSKWMVSSFTPEKREHYRQLGREAAKFLPHPSGPDAHNWQGGITEFRKMGKGCGGRTGHTLYTAWKKPFLVDAGHRCSFCDIGWGELHLDGCKAEIHVHHCGETMSSIIRKFTAGIPDVNALSWDERIDIWQNIIDYHIDSRVPGEVLCDRCHMQRHRKNPDVD